MTCFIDNCANCSYSIYDDEAWDYDDLGTPCHISCLYLDEEEAYER
jgi:hypothetical protein